MAICELCGKKTFIWTQCQFLKTADEPYVASQYSEDEADDGQWSTSSGTDLHSLYAYIGEDPLS